MNLQEHTEKIVKAANTNFYYAFVFLPPKKREAIFAAYAFSRHTDDIVDDAPTVAEARKNVDQWREELEACYHGHPSHPIAKNLQNVLQDFPIPQEHFAELINGVEMDLLQNRFQTFEDLHQYCYRVASVVGLMCIEIFGYKNPQTKTYAINLGLALQLTNIMRDVQVDLAQNRIYLPLEDLQNFNYTEDDLTNKNFSENFQNLMHHQSKRAHHYYAEAERLLPREDQSSLFPAEIMGKIYFELLRKIERADFNIFENQFRVPNSTKLWIALRYWAGTWFDTKKGAK